MRSAFLLMACFSPLLLEADARQLGAQCDMHTKHPSQSAECDLHHTMGSTRLLWGTDVFPSACQPLSLSAPA